MPVLIASFLVSVSFKNHIHLLLPYSPLWLLAGDLLKIVNIVSLPDPDVTFMEPFPSFCPGW